MENLIDSQVKQGYLYAVRLLAITKRSAEEMKKRLQDKGFAPEAVERVVALLEEKKILNDTGLIQEVVERGVNEKRLGRFQLQMALKKRGIKEVKINQALEQYSKKDERQNARGLAEEKFEMWKRLEPMKLKKKIYDFLVRKGYDFSLSREVTEELGKIKHDDRF